MDTPIPDAPSYNPYASTNDPFAPITTPIIRTAPAEAAAVNVPGATDSNDALVDDPAALVKYNCGDCESVQRFARGAMMRCANCGGRMFLKQRTKR